MKTKNNKIAKRMYNKFYDGLIVTLGYCQIASYTKEDKIFPGWMYQESEYKEEIENNAPEELVIAPGEKFKLVINYPLRFPYKVGIDGGKNGLTRRKVLEFVIKCYKQIYKEEDEFRMSSNKNTTDGKYGIWGHNISDLVLHSLIFKKNRILEVGVDS